MNPIKLYISLALLAFTSFAQTNEINRNFWQIGFTFGEIPVLSGSFKPGFTVGYHFNEYLMAEFTFQFKDYLQRDDESFNAANIGFEGLISSKETTGERLFLGLRYKPADWSPYGIAGVVLNFEDIETIKYDNRKRTIGKNNYQGELEVIQTRKTGLAPAFGIGYQYDFENGLSVNTNFAMAFFSSIADPDVEVNKESNIDEGDLSMLEEKMDNIYKDNFHNRYHIFNLGIIYRFN